jgi:hypothetical protein
LWTKLFILFKLVSVNNPPPAPPEGRGVSYSEGGAPAKRMVMTVISFHIKKNKQAL